MPQKVYSAISDYNSDRNFLLFRRSNCCSWKNIDK